VKVDKDSLAVTDNLDLVSLSTSGIWIRGKCSKTRKSRVWV